MVECQLLPVFVALGAWGRRFQPATEALSIRAELLERARRAPRRLPEGARQEEAPSAELA